MRKTTSVNYRNEAELIANCPLAAAMKLIGGRWKIMLLWYVHHGIDRFSDLKRVVPHIAEKVLYQQLREMERDLLLLRLVQGRSVTYRLTDLGESLVPVLSGLAAWATHHSVSQRLSALMTHASAASSHADTAQLHKRSSA